MNLIKLAIARPTAVISAVLMALLFGYVALTTIPIQLAPDVSRPIISVQTNWPGAAPAEVEREILNQQEDALKGLEGLRGITGTARNGRAEVELEFAVGTDMSRALLLTANRLDRVGDYPAEADEPTLETAGSDDNAIAWFRLRRLPGNDRVMFTYGDFAEDVIKERLERIEGVSQANVYGGGEREMQVIVDPARMAQFQLTVGDVVDRLRAANASVTGGDVEEGKRRYVVRTDNEFTTLEQVRSVVLRSDRDPASGRVGRVTVGDIADVEFGYTDATARIRSNGDDAIAVNATRETGANVITVMEQVRAAVAELNDGPLAREGLFLEQLYDETVYINSAIDLVIQNIWMGGVLAITILMIFLRSPRATLVIALAIPVSIVASFVAMSALGRSLNVVSLAGIAFAVGMVVDAAIVVLENIYRLRERGMAPLEAAYEGARRVWSAILVSALTTVMVFIPILVTEREVGQLFRDIAVAISVAVLLSLLVSVTVIPALSRWLLKGNFGADTRVKLPGIDHFARGFMWAVRALTRAVIRSRALALGIFLTVTAAAGTTAYTLLPADEYLPEGNRNFVFGIVFPPPGYNLETMQTIAERVESAVRPLWATPEEIAAAKQGTLQNDGPPKMRAFFFVALNNQTFMGAAALDDQRAGELVPMMTGPVFQEPGTFGVFFQPSIFGRGVGGARAVDIDVSGPELETIIGVAQRAAGLIGEAMPRSEGNQLRPRPGLELGAPEVRVEPDPVLLADNGVSARDLGLTVDAFNDGLRVAEITVDGQMMDLTLKGREANVTETQGIGALPVVTRDGTILPADALARVHVTAGPTEIRHRERLRTITLQVRPAPEVALGTALQTIQSEVIDPLRAEGLPPGVRIGMSGTADKLSETKAELQMDLLLAIVIVYLVMAVLFESFAYPLIILLSVPLAAAGGVVGLWLLNQWTFEPLHMLTMLGFVILVGIVVNNAILVVHQTLYLRREEGASVEDAILAATQDRVRPIFMSTLTSVFGMLPLVLVPGAGSEIYKGLGSVVVGGLALSAVLTLLVVPPLMSLFMRTIEGSRAAKPTPGAGAGAGGEPARPADSPAE